MLWYIIGIVVLGLIVLCYAILDSNEDDINVAKIGFISALCVTCYYFGEYNSSGCARSDLRFKVGQKYWVKSIYVDDSNTYVLFKSEKLEEFFTQVFNDTNTGLVLNEDYYFVQKVVNPDLDKKVLIRANGE